jgi:hypothetical protein
MWSADSFRRNPFPWARQKETSWGRGSRRFAPRSATRGPVGLGRMCVEAALKARGNLLGSKVLESPLLGYNAVQGGFEGALMVRRSRYEGGERTR